jgi:hypothetical protein
VIISGRRWPANWTFRRHEGAAARFLLASGGRPFAAPGADFAEQFSFVESKALWKK